MVAPLLAYLALVLFIARGLVRMTGTLKAGTCAAYGLPLAFFMPLYPAFLLDAFAGVAITRAVLLGSAAALALLAHALPHPPGEPAPAPAPLPRSPRALALALLALTIILFWIVGPLFGYDAFLYHLPIADELARTGHLPGAPITSIFDLPRGYPPLAYLANGTLWILQGTREHVTPRLMAMLFHLGCVLLLAVELGGTRGLVSAWLFATAPAYVEFVHAIGTDLPMAYLCLAWALRARAFLERGRPGDLVLAGLALTLALWTKYQALTFWAAGLAGVLAIRSRPLARVHLLALAAFLPFLARNALHLGNPVFPAFADAMGGAGLDPWTLEHLAGHVRASAGLALATSGLVWLGLCPALLIDLLDRRRDPSPADPLFRVTLWISTALWLVLWVRPASMPGRFLLPVLALAAARAAPGWLELESCPRESPLLPRLVLALLLAQLAWLAGTLGTGLAAPQEAPHSAYRALAFVLRDGHPGLLALALMFHRARFTRVSRRALVAALAVPLTFQCLDKQRWLVQKLARHGWIAHRSFDPDRIEYAWLARELPPDAKLLAVGGLPDLLPRNTLHLESAHQRDLLEAPTPELARQRLLARGITHVFVDEVVAGTLPLYRGGQLKRALTDRLLHEPGRMSIYRVLRTRDPR